jgi:deazaflavin-dependent oxidoreductase (nitroreductase family)
VLRRGRYASRRPTLLRRRESLSRSAPLLATEPAAVTLAASLERIRVTEAELYRRVNAVLEPAIRAGLGAPLLTPAGFVVVEMTGAKTGVRRRVPLAAFRFAHFLLVGTVRGERSLWVRNLAANGAVRVWLAARPRRMRAFVLRPGASLRAPRALPAALRLAWRALAPLTERGFAFALLAPGESAGSDPMDSPHAGGRATRAVSPRARASRRAIRARSR